ncbi:/ / hypothetical protein / 481508:481990 Reverse [Candidatus Hepatoplasma crinochetorum]|uniref:Uncharacterized protein n=1 Tax=Candidatus Hepatoplasma crinochetorum TaxID=295596 RepID=A0A0G7ZN02_9MOLU|nr:/ / hypothetical protein / 481508:481990 Reverse [Candidatus Hepatoplasma crinochetorum]
MEMWLQYFLLHMFFLGIIILLIVIILFARWHIYGPKLNNKIKNWRVKSKTIFDKDKPKVQRGAIIENVEFQNQLKVKEQKAQSAQELLSIHKEQINYQKNVENLKSKIEQKNIKQQEKVQTKKERKELKTQLKNEQKELKAQIKTEKTKTQGKEKTKKNKKEK